MRVFLCLTRGRQRRALLAPLAWRAQPTARSPSRPTARSLSAPLASRGQLPRLCHHSPSSTAQRQGEPAWHRRQRRARGNARALLRIAAAASLLKKHHSAQSSMPSANDGNKGQKGKGGGGNRTGGGGGGGKGGGGLAAARPQPGDWPCHLCGTQANRDWRERCRNCHAYRSIQMEKAFGDHAQRQSQQQRRSAQQQQQRQQQQQAQAKRDDEDRRQLRQRLERVQAELAAATAKTQHLAAASGGADEDEDEDAEDGGGYSAWTEDERNKRVELAKGGLAYAVASFGEDSAQAQGFREEIQALQRASREAKPFKAHRNTLERKKEDLQRKQERDEKAIARAKEEITELQGKVGTLQAAVDERAKQLRQVTDELNEIVRKALEDDRDGEEDDGGRTQNAKTDTPWSTLAAAVKGMEGQASVPPEVAALLVQLGQMACMHAAAPKPAPAAAAPSDAVPKAAAPTTPVVLAPHGRFGKPSAAAKNSPPQPPRPQPTTPSAGAEASGGGTAASSNGATGAAAAAAEAAARAENESEAELVEEAAGGGGPTAMDVDIEQSLSKLSEHEQRRIRSAIHGGAARGQRASDQDGETGAGSEEGGRRERERSPRPTKLHDKDL